MMGRNTPVMSMISILSTIIMMSRRSCCVVGRRNSPAFVTGALRWQKQHQKPQFTAGCVFTFMGGSHQQPLHQRVEQRTSSMWNRSSPRLTKMSTFMSATAEEQQQTVEASSASSSLVGIDWVREVVVTALNGLFDPKEIARNAAIAKLDGGKKKKPKKNNKKKNADELGTNNQAMGGGEEEDEKEPSFSEEERNSIIRSAVDAAQPFSTRDAMVTPATKPEFGDYQCNAALSLAKSAGLNPRECATKIVDQLRPLIADYMEEPEIAGPGFINFKFKDEYLSQALGVMAKDSMGRLGLPETG